jgi:hypothetical protein
MASISWKYTEIDGVVNSAVYASLLLAERAAC